MKKLVWIFIFFVMITQVVYSVETLKVRAITPISTENPQENITVEALQDITVGGFDIMKGYTLYGKMIDVVPPQKMGKNANFSMKIVAYDDFKDVRHELAKPVILKYRQQMRPNFERSTFSIGCERDSGLQFSPYDIKLMKESTSVWDYIKKDVTKDSFWQPGWGIILKKDDVFKFNIL